MPEDTDLTAALAMQQKIRATIPLSETMQFSIDTLDLDAIKVSAPLPPNVNIHGTGFAGSIYSIGILTGWALCSHILDQLEFATNLVVAKADIKYLKPVTADLSCVANITPKQREALKQALHEQSSGRLMLDIEVGDRAAMLHASFVAVVREQA